MPTKLAIRGRNNYSGKVYSFEKFLETANNNQWKDRRDKGYPWRTCVFNYIFDVYSNWIGHGLVQAHLKNADHSLWMALQKRLKTDPLPEWLPLPTAAQARKDAITNPDEQARMELLRAYWRDKNYKNRRPEHGRPEVDNSPSFQAHVPVSLNGRPRKDPKSLKKPFSVSLPEALIADIEKALGPGEKRSEWVADALRSKLNRPKIN